MTIRLRAIPALIPVNGREIMLRVTPTEIQWRYVPDLNGDTPWNTLIALSAIRGPIGPEPEFRSDGANLQYRAKGSTEWITLLPLGDILTEIRGARDGALFAASAADASAASAVTARVSAEAARDAAYTAGRIYPDTATGLAAVANGEYFLVPSPRADESFILYRDVSGIATEIKRFPSNSAIIDQGYRISVLEDAAPGYTDGGFQIGDTNGNVVFEVDSAGVVRSGSEPDTTLPYSAGGFQIGDANGNIVLDLDEAGRLTSTPSDAAVARSLVPLMGSGIAYEKTVAALQQIAVIDGNGETVVSDGTANDRYPSLMGGAVKFATDRNGGLREARMFADGKSVVSARGSKKVYLLVGYGQSTAVGAQAGATLITPTPLFPGSVLRFNRGVRPIGEQDAPAQSFTVIPPANIDRLVPLTETLDNGGVYGETHLGTLAYRLFEASSARSVSVAPGIGGLPIGSLSKGTTPYDNVLACVSRATALINGLGWELETIITWDQGEANLGDTRASYKAALIQLYNDLSADIRGITRQAQLHFFLCQTSSLDRSQIPLAQWEVSKEIANIHCVGPLYDVPFQDNFHQTAVGYSYKGDKYALAIKTVIFDAALWKPLQPISAVRTGTTIDIMFEGQTGALVLDTTNVPDVGSGKGFEFFDSTATPPAITNVAIIAGGVRLTLASVPTGTNPFVRAAWTRPGALPAANGGARTNVADQTIWPSRYNARPLPKRPVHFEIPVT